MVNNLKNPAKKTLFDPLLIAMGLTPREEKAVRLKIAEIVFKESLLIIFNFLSLEEKKLLDEKIAKEKNPLKQLRIIELQLKKLPSKIRQKIKTEIKEKTFDFTEGLSEAFLEKANDEQKASFWEACEKAAAENK